MTVFLLSLVNEAICRAVRSLEKYLIISLILFSDIFDRAQYLFFIDVFIKPDPLGVKLF